MYSPHHLLSTANGRHCWKTSRTEVDSQCHQPYRASVRNNLLQAVRDIRNCMNEFEIGCGPLLLLDSARQIANAEEREAKCKDDLNFVKSHQLFAKCSSNKHGGTMSRNKIEDRWQEGSRTKVRGARTTSVLARREPSSTGTMVCINKIVG
jgi:hypothetical protein